MKHILKYLLVAGLPLTGVAQTITTPIDQAPSLTEHQWLYGVGYVNVLDTYLSPLTYQGPSLSVWHRSERLAKWGKGKVTVQGNFGGQASYIKSEADDDKAWDGNINAGVAWHRNWRPVESLRLAAGGFLNLGMGFTYLLKGGNNPAQGRLHLEGGFSGIAEQDFHIRKYPMTARVQLDVPLIGAMFTPNFGQSYYEIFSLGHYDKNIRATHPFNAPCARFEATLRFPVAGAVLTAGYLGDVRQSHVNHLKHHAWNNAFVIGYVRQFQLIRPHKHK